MLDNDLANLYGVLTGKFNEQIKRNLDRFPENFMFQLTKEEAMGGKRKFPYVFTEQGIAMLSSVLRSDIAIKVSIEIIKAFVSIKRFIFKNKKMAEKNKF